MLQICGIFGYSRKKLHLDLCLLWSLQRDIQMFHELQYLSLLIRFLQFWKWYKISSDKLCYLSSFRIDWLSIGGVRCQSYSSKIKQSFFYRELSFCWISHWSRYPDSSNCIHWNIHIKIITNILFLYSISSF